MRVAAASILIALGGQAAGCAGKDAAPPPPPVLPLRAGPVAGLPRLAGTVQCGCTRRESFIALSDAGPTLIRMQPEEPDGIEVLADGGDGPGDLPPGPMTLSVVGDSVLVHHPTRGETRVFGTDGFITRVRHPFAVVSAASVSARLVVAMHTGWKRGEAGRAALGIAAIDSAEAGESAWHLARRIEKARVTRNRDADYLMHLLQRVQRRDESTFYRCYLWGGEPIEIRDVRGRLRATVPVPGSVEPPAWAARRELDEAMIAGFLTLRDAQSDAAGRLHVLVPGRGAAPDTLVVLGPDGAPLARHPLDRRLACLAVRPDGAGWLGVDARNGEILRLFAAGAGR